MENKHKNKHTPAPWVVSKSHPNHVDKNIMTEDGYSIADTAGHYSSIQDEKVIKANADLIACAPELFELAELLEESLLYQIKVDRKNGDDEGANLKEFTLIGVQEVLARARGD